MELRPEYPEANNNLGIILCEMKRQEEAVEVFHRTLSLQPGFPEAWKNLGSALEELEKHEEAIDAFERALTLRPDFPDTWNRLGKALQEMKRKPQAMEAFRRAVALQPDSAVGWNNLGNSLHEAKQPEEAIQAYNRSLALDSNSPDTWINLGMVLRDLYRTDEAIEVARRALGLKRDFAPAWNILTGVLNDVGKIDEVMDCFDQAIAVRPQDELVRGSRICTLHYHPDFDDEAIYREARQWNERFARPLAGAIVPHGNDPSPDRRLRIGYVSPDFRKHCVALFLSPLLSCHDHREFEIFCYSGVVTPDAVTARLRRHADQWREIFKVPDEEVARQIRRGWNRHPGGPGPLHRGRPAAGVRPQARSHPSDLAGLPGNHRAGGDGLPVHRCPPRPAGFQGFPNPNRYFGFQHQRALLLGAICPFA